MEHPIQVIDILALWGDSADNIPGAPGIGEKTAKKLIGQFDSVEGVYENIEQLKGKQKENLENSREQVRLSKILTPLFRMYRWDFSRGNASENPRINRLEGII